MLPRDVTGTWNLHQGNSFTLHVDVVSEDGDGTFNGKGNIHGQPGFIELTDTRATDDEITFQMGNGRYVGRFDFQGRLTGMVLDLAHPHSHAFWFVDKLLGFL
ncbi:hypothetical protein ACIHAX_19510 [Nocardia sp. NPDC051929]|uniref:hypothetical protein n=1 Tax=unclassified Nocardia TaxID=2637762 RepID=UPI003413EEC1